MQTCYLAAVQQHANTTAWSMLAPWFDIDDCRRTTVASGYWIPPLGGGGGRSRDVTRISAAAYTDPQKNIVQVISIRKASCSHQIRTAPTHVVPLQLAV